MPRRIRVRGIDQDVGVDENHSPPFHSLVEGVPVRDIDVGAAAVKQRQGR
jgi:hypothetical protein